MSEKLENKNKRRRGLPGAFPLCSPAAAGRPSQEAAQPASSSVVFSPSPKQVRARATAGRGHTLGHATSLPACLPLPSSSGCLERRHAAAPVPFPLPLALPPPWFSLPRAHPSAAAAIAHRRHGHQPSLVAPACLREPPRLRLLPRCPTQPGTHHSACTVLVFNLGRPRSSSPPCSAPAFPEQADQPIDLPVSLCFEPLSSSSRFHRLGLSSAMAEARLRSSLSPALLRRPFGHASASSTLAEIGRAHV